VSVCFSVDYWRVGDSHWFFIQLFNLTLYKVGNCDIGRTWVGFISLDTTCGFDWILECQKWIERQDGVRLLIGFRFSIT
jgi:hypothetical protein